MSRRLGCNVTFGGQKCLSISTGVQTDGTYEFFVNALGGSGVERHVHGYASVSSEGVVVRGGARVKNAVGEYLSTGLTLSNTTQEIARVVITPTPAGPVCQLTQLVGDDWLATDPSTMGGTIRRTEVALPASSNESSGEYSISMFDARTGVPSNSSQMVVVPFAAPLPFGVAFQSVRSS